MINREVKMKICFVPKDLSKQFSSFSFKHKRLCVCAENDNHQRLNPTAIHLLIDSLNLFKKTKKSYSNVIK